MVDANSPRWLPLLVAVWLLWRLLFGSLHCLKQQHGLATNSNQYHSRDDPTRRDGGRYRTRTCDPVRVKHVL